MLITVVEYDVEVMRKFSNSDPFLFRGGVIY